MSACEIEISKQPPKKRQKTTHNDFTLNLQQQLSESDELNDVTFIVGNDECGKEHISGIRAIFALQSPVFKALLYGNMKESKENPIIEDITPDAFSYLQKLFYCQNPKLDYNIIMNVLYSSKKYLLYDLEIECYKFLENIGNLNDWWNVMFQQQNGFLDDENLKDALIRKSKMTFTKADEIIQNYQNLSKLNLEALMGLVESSSLVVSKESLVYEACIKYCENYIKNMKDLNNVNNNDNDINNNNNANNITISSMMNKYFIEDIRFPIMNQKYFLDNIMKSDILCKDDTIDILASFNQTYIEYKYKTKFCCHKRNGFAQCYLSIYDIKSLKNGCKIRCQLENEFYEMDVISNIKWTNSQTKHFIESITFENGESVDYNQSVQSMRRDMHFYDDQIFSNFKVTNTTTETLNNPNTKIQVYYGENEWYDAIIDEFDPTNSNPLSVEIVVPVEKKDNDNIDQTETKIIYFHPEDKSIVRMC